MPPGTVDRVPVYSKYSPTQQSLLVLAEREKGELFALFNTGDVGALEPAIKHLFASIAYNNYTKNNIERSSACSLHYVQEELLRHQKSCNPSP